MIVSFDFLSLTKHGILWDDTLLIFEIPKDRVVKSLQMNPQLKYDFSYFGLEMKCLSKQCELEAYYRAGGTILEGSRNFRNWLESVSFLIWLALLGMPSQPWQKEPPPETMTPERSIFSYIIPVGYSSHSEEQ